MVICPNGHSVCYQCCRGMKTCPQCRSPCLDKPIPNITLLKTLDNLVNLKILVVGDSGVGKSSLMLRYTDDKFMMDILPTVGLDFRVKVMEHRGFSVKLSVWDTAGQERFKNISSAYYRGAHGVVLVYDITSQKSLDHLDTWLEELDKYDSEDKEKMMVRLVVGNKSDQAHARQVESEKGMLWAEQRGISFLESSAKRDKSVETVFTMLVDQILQKPELWEGQQEGGIDSGGGGANVLLRQVAGGGNRSGDNQCCLLK